MEILKYIGYARPYSLEIHADWDDNVIVTLYPTRDNFMRKHKRVSKKVSMLEIESSKKDMIFSTITFLKKYIAEVNKY